MEGTARFRVEEGLFLLSMADQSVVFFDST